MLKAEIVWRDPKVGQILFAATSRVTSLAKAATEEPSAPRDNHPLQLVQLQEELGLAKADEGTPPNSTSSASMATYTGGVGGPRNSPLLSPFAVSRSLSSKGEIFGNGWFGLKPSLSHLSFRGASRADPEGTFALKLMETTLNLTYFSLLECNGDPSGLAMRICQFALLYHSREEILFNLRWFLGPGYLAIPSLSRAIFGFDHTLSVQHLNAMASGNEAKIFSPFIDAQALVEAPSKLPRHAFMNAWNIEEYLRSKGAVHFDQDVLPIRVQSSSEVERMEYFDEISPEEIGVLAKHHYFETPARPVEPEMLRMSYASLNNEFVRDSSDVEFQAPASPGIWWI